MGLLDDAIREHLELKRQRGADPDEIERLENEALGPVRRATQEADDDPFAGEDELGGSFAGEDGLPLRSQAGDEPGLFDHHADAEEFEPAEFAEPAEFEPPTEIAARPALEPETDPGLRESPRHHDIAEEWESQRRQNLEDESRALDSAPEHPPSPAPAPSDADPIPPSHGERSELVEQETAEYHVEDEPGHEPQGEDVLEETPEFLQDTPDHDRLWFEQRPPRDFDLDG